MHRRTLRGLPTQTRGLGEASFLRTAKVSCRAAKRQTRCTRHETRPPSVFQDSKSPLCRNSLELRPSARRDRHGLEEINQDSTGIAPLPSWPMLLPFARGQETLKNSTREPAGRADEALITAQHWRDYGVRLRMHFLQIYTMVQSFSLE